MSNLFIFFLVGLTSWATYEATKSGRTKNTKTLREGIRALLEWVGAFALFFIANLMLGVLFVFLIRSLTPRFVALYVLQNILLLVLSAAQAFVFLYWWKRD